MGSSKNDFMRSKLLKYRFTYASRPHTSPTLLCRQSITTMPKKNLDWIHTFRSLK